MQTTLNKSRRSFVKTVGMLGMSSAAASLAACRAVSATVPTTALPAVAPPASDVAAPTHNMTDTTTNAPQGQGVDDMDAMHEAGVKKFLANIGKYPGFWGSPLPFIVDNGTKVFELTASELKWQVNEGNIVDAVGYNGMVPGPVIRVTDGDNVRINVTNKLKESHAVHWHGLRIVNSMDGVPFITQPPIKPGASFIYEFKVNNAGSQMYHSHHNSAQQTSRGLLGAFIVEPKDKSREPAYDSEYILVLNDVLGGFTVNGKGFPETQPIIAKLGERIRIRYMNEGMVIHPMHLHGLEQQVIAKDGWPVPQPYFCDTLTIAPGERWDVIVTAHTAGVWAFHCHILTHAESPTGMFGMVTAVVVK